jgi:hypothetical protein
MIQANGGQIVGLFATEEDAKSSDADKLALATILADRLSAEELAIASENSQELSD